MVLRHRSVQKPHPLLLHNPRHRRNNTVPQMVQRVVQHSRIRFRRDHVRFYHFHAATTSKYCTAGLRNTQAKITTRLDFFFRVGLVLIPDVLSSIITYTLLANKHFHPVYALVQSIVVFCLYPIFMTFNVIFVLSDETGLPEIDAWRQLCYAEMGLQAVLTVCWIGLLACSAVAVDKMRVGKGEARMRAFVRAEMELKDMGPLQEDGKWQQPC